MQTIYLDISNKGVIPTVYAKQNDVGRKFAVILTDSGLPYIPVSGSAFSVWYSGASGEGNYTDIGDKSAFSLNGNKVEVEMIVQMLSAHGDGILCLTLNSPNGNQISSWNIPYMCEIVPGSESEKAKEYYTAFSKSVEKLKQVTENLTPEAIGAAPAVESAEYPGCYYRTVNGVVEWLNPPMMPKEEYRTTERCEGKPVYAKRIPFTPTSDIAADSEFSVHHGISNFDKLLRCYGNANQYPIPYFGSDGSHTGVAYCTSAVLVMATHGTGWGTNYTFHFDLFYTKTT